MGEEEEVEKKWKKQGEWQCDMIWWDECFDKIFDMWAEIVGVGVLG